MSISVGKFLLLWFLYSIASIVAFIFSSMGYFAAFIYPIAGVIVYGVLFIIIAILSIIFYITGVRKIQISSRVLWTILAVQLFFILFNYGDCADSGGGAVFLDRILFGVEIGCWTVRPGAVIGEFFNTGMGILLVILYIYLIATSFWRGAKNHILKKNTEAPLTNKKGMTMQRLTAIMIGVAIAIVLLVLLVFDVSL